MKPVQILLITVLLLGALALQVAAQGEGGTMSFSTDYASWIISPDGKALSLLDKASGQDYAGQPAHPIAVVRVAGTDWFATSASFDQGKLTVGFGESGIRMVLGLTKRAHYVMAQVLSVEGEGIEQLTFVGIPTRLTGDVAEPFSVCALALNLQTNVTPLPGQMTWLQAICYPRFGLVGAKVAIVNVFCPYSKAGYFFAGRIKEIETDGMGQSEATFVKGSTVDIVLVGTSMIRRIVVPSSGTEFDIMDPTLVQDDPFQIQVPDLPAAPRSS